MTKLTKNDNGTWWGYLWQWGDEIPERPGQHFKPTDRTIVNMAALPESETGGVKAVVRNVQKADPKGLLVVVQSDEDLTQYELGYTLTSDNDILDERPYDAVSGEYRYKLLKYPIKQIVLKKTEAVHASTNTGPVVTSIKRPKRAR